MPTDTENEKKEDIRILVACHKPAYVPENPLLCPIQVGAALSREHMQGMLHDDEGIHISEKNRSYCELTAIYWAWKNLEADYYGLFHYRRYFSFDVSEEPEDIWGNIPEESISPEAVEKHKLDEASMRQLIRQ